MANDDITCSIDKRSALLSSAIGLYISIFSNLSLLHFRREVGGIQTLVYLGQCFNPMSFNTICMFCACTLLAHHVLTIKLWKRDGLLYLIPAAVFGFFMIEGHYFETSGAVDFFSRELFFRLICIVSFSAYLILFFLLLLLADSVLTELLRRLTKPYAKGETDQGLVFFFLNAVKRRPFTTSFALLLVCLVLLTAISYPGLFPGDSPKQIAQALNVSTFDPYVILIDESVKLFNHHPIMHTLLIRLCLWIGSALSLSDNASIFLYVIVQGTFACALYSLCIRVCVVEIGISPKLASICLVAFVLHPREFPYLVQITKDTLYCAFLTLLICMLYSAVRRRALPPSKTVALTALSLGVVLFRNEGIYLLLPLYLLTLVSRNIRREVAIIGATLAVFWVVWGSFILPALAITPGSKREMLSLPFQQTARYVVEHPDDVTEEEREAIDSVLEYDLLARRYDPILSDPVKSLYREGATTEDLSRYFGAWASMFSRHHVSYIRATLHNKYQYFYPSNMLSEPYSYFEYQSHSGPAGSTLNMEKTNALCGTDFSYPTATDDIRFLYESARETFFSLPFMRLIISSYTYVLATLFVIFYCLLHRRSDVLLVLVPLILQIAVIIAGPTNGYYFRYTLPISMLLPFIVAFLSLDGSQIPEEVHHQTESLISVAFL